MNRELALAKVKEQLTPERYEHTIGVMETAIYLAKRYGANEKQAEIAAIFHDYAKYRPKAEMKKIIINQHLPKQLLQFHSELWHAPVGAYLVKTEVGIKNELILDAIRYHTTGRPKMTLLEKVIYLADYIEPGRQFLGVEEVRTIADKNLDEALFTAIKRTIIFLSKKNRLIYPDTFHTYNDFIFQKEDMLNE